MLIQFESNDTCTRTYLDFDDYNSAMDGLTQIYEQRLQLKPGKTPTYVFSDLVAFIDSLADIVILVWEDPQKVYIPYSKDWIKSKLYRYLQKNAPKKRVE
jgi:hypothetical protein